MSDAHATRVESHSITTRDNTLLHANLYRPNIPNDKAVIIGGAMGIPQRFYRHYATYLAEQGFVVLTFDFRGIGDSKNGNLWGFQATLLDWGAEDMQAVCAWVMKQYPAHQVYLIAHSISGQLAGLMRHVGRLSGIMGVAAQNIHWRRWQWQAQMPLWLMWNMALPSVTHAVGFFPSEIFGLGERLPKGVALDWARTARNRNP